MGIDNTFNFFEIHSDRNTVTFWGMDITPTEISISPEIKRLIKILDLPYDEVIEILEDDSIRFYYEVHILGKI